MSLRNIILKSVARIKQRSKGTPFDIKLGALTWFVGKNYKVGVTF